jgi:hypothetical protein
LRGLAPDLRFAAADFPDLPGVDLFAEFFAFSEFGLSRFGLDVFDLRTDCFVLRVPPRLTVFFFAADFLLRTGFAATKEGGNGWASGTSPAALTPIVGGSSAFSASAALSARPFMVSVNFSMIDLPFDLAFMFSLANDASTTGCLS